MASPKLFMSYSWTTPDHESWVLRLATELRESGIEVILDKWDLREGHDAHAFMEKMPFPSVVECLVRGSAWAFTAYLSD
ncbi:MAG: SEFIR domain-containing protein [Candidatus Sulfotelmatobacter sp.]